MIHNSVLVMRTYYYPLRNTPAVSLTQDLPPEQDADILLLGCGDARNILFTCFADAARKIDVTCCDIEPGIHARNILLYSLLMEDQENVNIEPIWNIYFHWKLDNKSMDLLETQSQKLLALSGSTGQWHASVYGSSIRFCDERSLSLVRSYWIGFWLRGLSDREKALRQNQMQAAINKAKDVRNKLFGKLLLPTDLIAASPVFNYEVIMDLSTIAREWWDSGTMTSSNKSAPKSTQLNPTFLYSQNPALTLHFCLSPLAGFPLCTAYAPVDVKSPFYCQRKSAISTEHQVDCAKNHFNLWASAFRKALKNKSVIRIFCGDALAFGLTLRHCQLTLPEHATSMNLFCNNFTSSPLKLLHEDYGTVKKGAPLRFDVIDMSTLADELGPMNVISIGSSLLKCHGCSILYTELLIEHDPKKQYQDPLSSVFGLDAPSITLLFGLVPPDLFTNATDNYDSKVMVAKLTKLLGNTIHSTLYTQKVYSRLRWKQLQQDQPHVQVKAQELVELLVQVYNVMFEYESPISFMKSLSCDSSSEMLAQSKERVCCNHLSFALLLNLLRTTVITDWNQCIEELCEHHLCYDLTSSIIPHISQDLLLQLRLCGVHDFKRSEPVLTEASKRVRALILPLCAKKKVPEQVCVTLRVPREKLKLFTEKGADQTGTPALTCTFKYIDDNSGDRWVDIFSAVHATFGKWQDHSIEGISYPYIEEDSSQLLGTSDLFVSVYVPIEMLLKYKRSVPLVSCSLVRSQRNRHVFAGHTNPKAPLQPRTPKHAPDLCFATAKMTSKDVFITRYMPGMSALPLFVLDTARQEPTLPTTTVRFPRFALNIDTVIQRIPVKCPEAKAKLVNPSSVVKIEFKSPLTALVSIAQSEKLKVDFPVPLSPSKYKVHVERELSYIEVESPLFNPFIEDATCFMLPTVIGKAPSSAVVPMLWTSTRIDLEAMPPLYIPTPAVVSWLVPHTLEMFSEREHQIYEEKLESDLRIYIKNQILTSFMIFAALKGPGDTEAGIFGISNPVSGKQILIFPSCVRLDLMNHTIVSDAAVIPMTNSMFSDPKMVEFLKTLKSGNGFFDTVFTEDYCRVWKTIMPALVERCRTTETWKHTPDCEYIQTNEVPISRGLHENGVSSICSCGIGQFPEGYLKNQMERFPNLSYVLKMYATRAAIGPIFVASYLEKYSLQDDLLPAPKCWKCSELKEKLVGKQILLNCSRCKRAKYCSKQCQKEDWKNHKPYCVMN